MNSSNSRLPNILEMPDEVLIKIILHLNPRERVALGRSCERLNTLVFEDKELLRHLDFSEDEFLTSSDVYAYFKNENGSTHILKLNLKNVTCLNSSYESFDYIKKATNLVDVNIQGIKMRDFSQLVSLLAQLRCVKKLSIDWPPLTVSQNDDHSYPEVCNHRFSQLTYLAVRIRSIAYAKQFYRILQSCHELKELFMVVTNFLFMNHQPVWGIKLKNLDVVKYHGPGVREVEEYYLSMISHPEQLTHFQLTDTTPNEMGGFYLERNIAACDELLKCKSMKTLLYNYPRFAPQLGGFVISSCLIEEVIRINHKSTPERFCCLSPFKDEDEEGRLGLPSVLESSGRCMLRIEEAKRLLKNPKCQISYLNIKHNIEADCDAHVVASIFPNLTGLVLSNVTKKNQETLKKSKLHLNKSPGKSHSSAAATKELDEVPNSDSCFSKLIKSTPYVRHLRINGNMRDIGTDELWDSAALRSIPGWKSLTTLQLWHVPIVDGKFLIEIGKHCKQLAYLEFYKLVLPGAVVFYENELNQMLIHCSKLRHYVLLDDEVGQLSKLLCSFTNNNRQLRIVHVGWYRKRVDVNKLRPSIKQLLQHCSELTKLVFYIDGISEGSSHELTQTLESLAYELNRPNFKFELHSQYGEPEGIIHEDFPELFCL